MAETRRAWLLRLGEFTALAGFAGRPDEAAPVPADAIRLPPGLYEPSLDHLMHMRMREGRGEIPAGSETDFVVPGKGPHWPVFFSPEELLTITRVVELILGEPVPSPETIAEVAGWIDLVVAQSGAVLRAAQNLSPLHRTLALHYYGTRHVEELEHQDLTALCREGMPRLAGFGGLDKAQQVERLSSMSGEAFFTFLKHETLRGYYTSREGLAELDYKGNSFYTESPGCAQAG